MSIQKIVVDLDVIDRKIQSFEGKLSSLRRLMEGIELAMRILSTVSWVSPASWGIYQAFRLLYNQILEAIRIVEEYIHDLSVVRQQYGEIETVITDRVRALPTDVFGI